MAFQPLIVEILILYPLQKDDELLFMPQETVLGTGKMAQSVKCLPNKHEDLSSDGNTYIKIKNGSGHL